MKDFLIIVGAIVVVFIASWGVSSCVLRELHCNSAEAEEIMMNNLGRFKVLEKQGEYQDSYYHLHRQYLVYDEATYIIYVYDVSSYGGVSISPYYCMNADNEPEIAVYWDGMDIE